MIAGVGAIGCTPNILAQNLQNQCSSEVNNLVMPFNGRVKTMVNNLNANLPGAKFIYIDIFGMFSDILNNPGAYGMRFFADYLYIDH